MNRRFSHNQECIKSQLAKFLDFDPQLPNTAEMVNNYDWMKELQFPWFHPRNRQAYYSKLHDVERFGEKTSRHRVASGMSFTEFSYQLVQGTDFLHLYETMNCRLQMGGSDQWGNITTGTELIRGKSGGEAYALTCPLITKADGSKFGKTEIR